MIIHVIVYEFKLADTYSNKVFESVCVLGGGGADSSIQQILTI